MIQLFKLKQEESRRLMNHDQIMGGMSVKSPEYMIMKSSTECADLYHSTLVSVTLHLILKDTVF